jgi:membrane protein
MIGKPRPNPDRTPGDAAKQPSSGALIGMSGLGRTAAKARQGFFAAKRPADPAISTVRSAAVDAQKSRLPQMAAALSYRTIFGLLPVILVALVAVKYFASEEQVRTAVEKVLDYSGLSAIAVQPEDTFVGPRPPAADKPAMDSSGVANGETPQSPDVSPADPSQKGADDAVAGSAPVASMDEPPPAVDKWITDLIARVNKISFATIGYTAAAMLIYAAMAMLVEIELAFNQIYRVPRGRSWARRIMQYWTLLTLGPLGLLATFYVSQQYIAKAQASAAEWGAEWGAKTLPTELIGFVITVSISTLFFFIAYITVPNTKVKLRPALVGALAAAFLWEGGKWGFTKYLAHSTGTAQLYGALALLPLFLLWVYFTWLIVLFGLQIAYQLQHGRAKTRAQPISDMGPMLVDPAAALVVLTSVARGFETGSTLDALTIAKGTKLPEPVVRMVVGKLAERGLLHRIDGEADEAEPSYALAKSPTTIRVAEVLELGYELAGTAEPDDGIARLHRAQIEMVGDQTLESLTGPARSPIRDGRLPAVEAAAAASKSRGVMEEPSRPAGTAATLPQGG